MIDFNQLPCKDRIYYKDESVVIYCGDCRDILPRLSGVSAVVTDPPYEISFMSKSWDSKGISFQIDTWRLIREACLPGAMLLSFGGTRTFHRIACAVEDAGWQIRDTICWVYGSGFPKSLDISKAIDKTTGTKRERVQLVGGGRSGGEKYKSTAYGEYAGQVDSKNPTTPEAKLWEGYGTGLKPAYEPIIVAMNPLDGTFANNALKHGVAGLNIDGTRIGITGGETHKGGFQRKYVGEKVDYRNNGVETDLTPKGRFPANFIHDGSQEVMELFPETKSGGGNKNSKDTSKSFLGTGHGGIGTKTDWETNTGSAVRFFYCAKASRSERDAGLEDMPIKVAGGMSARADGSLDGKISYGKNNHPTIKPLSLMTYLCKLVKMPEYNLILDPFCGSGSTLLACKKLGIPCVGIDNDEKYCEIAAKRCQGIVDK